MNDLFHKCLDQIYIKRKMTYLDFMANRLYVFGFICVFYIGVSDFQSIYFSIFNDFFFAILHYFKRL